jgi:hypothetical protein
MVGAVGSALFILADAADVHIEKTIRLMVIKATVND